jgi:4'-phosphopantetheinyl transferase
MPTDPKILWPPAMIPPRFRAGDVHLWCAGLDEVDTELFEHLLSDDERQRTGRLNFNRDRQRFVAARGLLREILARYLGARPADLRFDYGRFGKPALAGPAAGRELQFNLSHSGALALYAITRGEPIGVDLEQVRPMENIDLIAKRFFRPAEADLLRRLGPDRQLETFFQLWTQKEALVKARGVDLDDTLTASDYGSLAYHSRARGREPEHPLIVTRLQPAAGYTAAVAFAGLNPHLHCWQWVSRIPAGIQRAPVANCA